MVIREAWRALRSAPGSTTFCLLILTSAIAWATVTFSVVDAVVLRSLPFENSDRREALGLFVADAEAAPLVDHVKLPTTAARVVREYASLKKKAKAQDRRATAAAKRAVRFLRRGTLKMSGRDAARLLGLSHQRVHQLAQDEA
jgi:hypothetical protein